MFEFSGMFVEAFSDEYEECQNFLREIEEEVERDDYPRYMRELPEEVLISF